MRRLTILLVVLAWLPAAQLALANPRGGPRGPAQADRPERKGVAGRVLAPSGVPIVGSRIELTPSAGRGPARTVTSDSAGNWRVVGLRPGIWLISVDADGYRRASGKVDVRAGRELIETILEVDADLVVRDWLEEANGLLAEGSASRAQELYERALSVVPLPQSPPLHRALARAHFLQGRVDDAVRSLQRALLIAPADEEARLLLPAVLGSVDRGAEAEGWLELLDSQGAASAGGAAFGVTVETRDLAPTSIGRFRTSVQAAAPAGAPERLLAALGSWERLGVPEGSGWSPAGESFEVYVPEDKTPSYGLLVWISPTPRGGLTDPEMPEVLDQHSMIWIGANAAGNARPRADRMRLALDAVNAVRGAYPIDPQRIYVGGYSGGGRMASTLALHFPDIFTGGVYFMGVDFYRNVPKADQPGTFWGPVLQSPTAEAKAEIERRSRFVFITGAHDFNRAQTYAYRDEYLADGFERVKLIEIPRAGHYHGFKASELSEAIAFLDLARP